MYKQVIAVRSDLKLPKGKLAAQVAHASLSSFNISPEKQRQLWEEGGQKKVVVKVQTLAELMELHKKAKAAKLPCALVKDAGLTQREPGTVTCLGIGPAKENEIDKITGKLKLL